MKMGLLFWGVVAMVAVGGIFAGVKAFASDVPSVDVLTLEQQMTSDNPPLLLDVREDYETAQGIIQDATLIPLSVLDKRAAELPKDRLIAVYCRSGNRSLRAISILQSKGYTLLENVGGGYNAWVSKCSSSKKYC